MSDLEDRLDEVADALGDLPEPLAAAAASIEVARADGDSTGVKKHCFEVGVDVVRYATAVALALAAQAFEGRRAPKPLAKELTRAARMTDGQWCALLRTLAAQLGAAGVPEAELFSFATSKALGDLVASRNLFAHEGGRGHDAPERLLALLDLAEPLLSRELVLLKAGVPPVAQRRVGLPLRAGAWRKRRGSLPEAVTTAGAYLVLDEARWLALSPWLPALEERLLLPDSPHAGGKPWRMLDPETGERRPAPELDAALRRLVGDDAAVPMVPSERPALVGRSEIIQTLRRTAELAAEGGVYLVVLTGPQGIGRGRLVELVRESAAGFGFGTLLEASCSQARRAPLRPLRRALAAAPELAEVAAAVERAASGDALAGRAGLEAAVEAVEETLVEASVKTPLLITLDDAQWADDPTLQLLSLLVERATTKADGHMLVVAAVRDEPNASRELTRLLGEVERDVGPGATRLAIGPIAEPEARQLVKHVAPVARSIEDALVHGAAGVPFLMVQSLLAWFETGALSWEQGAWRPARLTLLDEPVPGMADVVRARLVSYFEPGSRAERAAEQLLFCLGVAGGWLPLAQLIGAGARAGIEQADSEHVLEVLVECGLLSCRADGREYGFGQTVVQRAVLDELRHKPWAPRVQRALLAEVAAQGDDEDAPFVARGYLELGDEAGAARWFRRAVSHGLRVGLFRQVVGWAERLAQLSAGARERDEALLFAVDALIRAGDPKAARARLEALGRPADPELAIKARILWVATASALGEQHADETLVSEATRQARVLGLEASIIMAKHLGGVAGLALAERAAGELTPEIPPELRYRVMASRLELLAEVRTLNHPEVREAMTAAESAARDTGSVWAHLDALNDQGVMEMAAGNYDSALELFKRVAGEAGEHHFGSMQRGALVNMAAVQLRAGRLSQAAAVAEQAAEGARHAGDARLRAMALSLRADALLKRGQLEPALAAVDEAVAIGQRMNDSNLPIRLFRRADIRLNLGRVAEALDDLEQALAHAQRSQNEQLAIRARVHIALVRFDRGDVGAAEELKRRLAEIEALPDSPAVRQLISRARERIAS